MWMVWLSNTSNIRFIAEYRNKNKSFSYGYKYPAHLSYSYSYVTFVYIVFNPATLY